ncbi:MAG: hypothetical protein WBG30_00285 [Psychrilyobacter sp.]|uniref:hypothetical protein n=1 Tax=Psychrilyobacter sp. TaxID=2586924 RepID=UPI003C775EA4
MNLVDSDKREKFDTLAEKFKNIDLPPLEGIGKFDTLALEKFKNIDLPSLEGIGKFDISVLEKFKNKYNK